MSNPIKWLDRDDGPVNYGEPTYWERRYELDRKDFGVSYRHDWYFEHDRLKATFESYFGQPKGQRILIVGCGLSTIASQMHALGYRCITAIDISATAIAHMQAGDQNKEGVEYVIGDARKMDSLPDNLFDGVFDKGCADSLICSYRSTDDVVDMFHECCRVLRPEGVFLCVSHGAADARMHMFEHEGLQWLTNVIPMHGSEGLFVYVSTKWAQEEIDAAERKRLDDIESTLSMRSSGTFSHSTRTRPGVVHQNRILHAMTPAQLDAANQKREEEAAERKRARDEAKAGAKAKEAATAAAAAAEGAMIPFEGGAPTKPGATGDSSTALKTSVVSITTPTSRGSIVSAQQEGGGGTVTTTTTATTTGSLALQGAATAAAGAERISGGSNSNNSEGRFPTPEELGGGGGSGPATMSSSITITTAATEDLTANVIASG